jgi:hypothetical protein
MPERVFTPISQQPQNTRMLDVNFGKNLIRFIDVPKNEMDNRPTVGRFISFFDEVIEAVNAITAEKRKRWKGQEYHPNIWILGPDQAIYFVFVDGFWSANGAKFTVNEIDVKIRVPRERAEVLKVETQRINSLDQQLNPGTPKLTSPKAKKTYNFL